MTHRLTLNLLAHHPRNRWSFSGIATAMAALVTGAFLSAALVVAPLPVGGAVALAFASNRLLMNQG